MSKHTFKQGDVVFNAQGHKAIYIARISDGHVVHPGYVDQEDYGDLVSDFCYSSVDVWPIVFEEPPIAVVNEEIAELNKRLEELRVSVRVLNQSKLQLERDERERKARIAKHEKLQRLDDFIQGKITHYVEYNDHGNVIVIPFNKAVSNYDKRDLKLLTLFGTSKGDIAWRLSSYSDGSGSTVEVVPCCSEEEALSAAKERIDVALANWRSEKPGQAYVARYIADSCKRLGFEVPSDVANIVNEERLRVARKALEEAKKQEQSALAEIARFQGDAK